MEAERMNGPALKKVEKVFSFAFSNLFQNTNVSAILSATRASVDPKDSVFHTEKEIHEKLFLGANEKEKTIYGATQHLLTIGARDAIAHGMSAFIVGVSEDDPIFAMDIHDARIAAVRRIMLAAREANMAGNPFVKLPNDPAHPPTVMGHLLVRETGLITNLGTMRFSSWRLAKIVEEMEAFALFVQPSEKAKAATADLDTQANRALAEASRSARGTLRTIASEAISKHVPKPDPAAEFGQLWASVCSEVGTRTSKLFHIDVDSQEFGGDHVKANGGIAPDTEITYISSSFLNGLVNYSDNRVAMLYARYGMRDDDREGLDFFERIRIECDNSGRDVIARTRELYQQHADRIDNHLTGDCWLVVYESENSYYELDFDMDCSDCSIGRYSKESAAAVGINSLDEFLYESLMRFRERADFYKAYTGLDEPVIVRAPKINNRWLKF